MVASIVIVEDELLFIRHLVFLRYGIFLGVVEFGAELLVEGVLVAFLFGDEVEVEDLAILA